MKTKKLIVSFILSAILVFSSSGCLFSESSDSSEADTILIRISGSSMEPTFSDGEVIAFERTDESFSYKVEQIIAFKYNSTDEDYMVHRIYKKINYTGRIGYITKGDNMDQPDEEIIYPENIAGVYKKKYT